MNRDNHLIFESYKLHGLAANKTVEDIAKKHNVDVESIKTQLAKGIQVEHEHTTDEQTAKKIAMDHIYENPHYYDKLKKIEGEEDYVEKRKEKFDRAMDKYKDRENERDEKLKDSEENAESKHCEYAMKGCRCGKCSECTPKSEDAESGVQTYIYLDLYTGKTSLIPRSEFEEAIEGLEKVKGKITVYRGEEYMVLAIPGVFPSAVSKQPVMRAGNESSEENTQLPSSAGNSLQSKNIKV